MSNTPIYDRLWMEYFERQDSYLVVQRTELRSPSLWERLVERLGS